MQSIQTAEQWEAEVELTALVNCYRGHRWLAPLRLFACGCARHIWDLIPPGACREAVETGERFASGRCDGKELKAASSRAAAAVERTRRKAAEAVRLSWQMPGIIRVFGTLEECAASAAWACTFSGTHPALKVPYFVREAVHLRRYSEVNGGVGRSEVWSESAERAGLRTSSLEAAWQVNQLRALVGNPFRGAESEA